MKNDTQLRGRPNQKNVLTKVTVEKETGEKRDKELLWEAIRLVEASLKRAEEAIERLGSIQVKPVHGYPYMRDEALPAFISIGKENLEQAKRAAESSMPGRASMSLVVALELLAAAKWIARGLPARELMALSAKGRPKDTRLEEFWVRIASREARYDKFELDAAYKAEFGASRKFNLMSQMSIYRRKRRGLRVKKKQT